MEDRRIVEILEKFSNKLPTKGLVRVYLSANPLLIWKVSLFSFFIFLRV